MALNFTGITLFGSYRDDVVNAAKGGQRTSDKSGGEMVTHFGDKCDYGLNATKRGRGCCAFCDA